MQVGDLVSDDISVFLDDLAVPIFRNILEVLKALVFQELEVVAHDPDLISSVPLHVLEELNVFCELDIFFVAGEEVDLGLGGSEREAVVVGLQGAGNDSEGESAGDDAGLVHGTLVLNVVGKFPGRELEAGHHLFHGDGGGAEGGFDLKINYILRI